MRDFALLALLFALLPFCVTRPYIGILTFSWLSYMNPHRLTWGIAYDFPFAQLAAVATLVGVLLQLLRDGRLPRFPWERETVLLALLWLLFLITTFTALRPDLAWPEFKEISKILLITFLTIALIDDPKKLRALLLVIVISFGFFGLKGGLFAIATGGQYRVYGPEGSFIEDNNAIGLSLTMVLPFFFYMAKTETRPIVKRLLLLTFFLTILAIISTYSRGAFLGLAVVLLAIAARLSLRFKLLLVLVAFLAAPIAISQLPDKWIDRMNTIQTYEEDGSAQGRLMAWETAWKVATARPLTGGGFQVIDDSSICRHYNPNYTEAGAGVHSVYFEVLSENGFPALLIFLLLLGSILFSLQKVKRLSQRHGTPAMVHYAAMLQTSLFGYAVSGLFLEFASFDLFYQLVAISIRLKTFPYASNDTPAS